MGRVSEYRAAVAAVLEERGARCECCGFEPVRYVHHINPVSETGIASALVLEPANMLVVCNECHVMFHPRSRNRNMWWNMGEAAAARGRALNRGRR